MIKEFWKISSAEEFEREALELFKFQALHCAPYAKYLSLIGCDVEAVKCLDEIRYMPIELFKSSDVYCSEAPAEKIFTSSSTTGSHPSRHLMADLKIYEEAFMRGFKKFYGDVSEWSIYALLPSYLERNGSSLIYMADKIIQEAAGGGFYLYDHEKLLRDMSQDQNKKILLGVSYALWDLVEAHAPKLENTIVMETGGMKGHREEIDKREFHKILCDGFGVGKIHSEYGMAELTSQAYSAGDNIFTSPPWMRVVLREVNDPFSFLKSGRGAINIIDLASRYSCAFIETEDIGSLFADGSFSVEGRIAQSEIRGCNLLIQ